MKDNNGGENMPTGPRRSHRARYQEIAQVLARHGLGSLVGQLGIERHLVWPVNSLARVPHRHATHDQSTYAWHLRIWVPPS